MKIKHTSWQREGEKEKGGQRERERLECTRTGLFPALFYNPFKQLLLIYAHFFLMFQKISDTL